MKVALGRDFSSINSVVQFTVNMLATTPMMGQHTNLWMSGSRPEIKEVPGDFIRRFGEGWAKHVGQIIAQPVGFGGTLEVKNLESLKFDRQLFRDLGK